MIQKIMTLPIFMFTRISLSALIASIAGIMMICFFWMAWSFVDDVYDHLTRDEEAIQKGLEEIEEEFSDNEK
tara:strand:- start:183 stop:398 length:216 start_codon:yes stop_codon:yes gene_type:complete